MDILNLKDLIVTQIKNSNYIILVIFYILSVTTAIIIFFVYIKEKSNEIVSQDGVVGSEEISENIDGEIVVDISGAVNSPGVYRLSNKARLSDLLKSAGGVNKDASEKILSQKINLSQKLTDSQKIYIPFKWDEGQDIKLEELIAFEDDGLIEATNSISTKDYSFEKNEDNNIVGEDKININNATHEVLESLPGIGPAYAQKIIANRPYTDSDDFIQRSKVPQATITKFIQDISF